MLRAPRAALAVVALGATLAACGADPPPPVPGACTDRPETIVTALRTAPAPVRLAGGTRLSRCISDSDSDAELQNVGLAFHQVAELLRVRARVGDRLAAVALGYLVGATRVGARRTAGVMAELTRRVELVAGRLVQDEPRLNAAVDRGLRAGAVTG
jgi:hypothetical protein